MNGINKQECMDALEDYIRQVKEFGGGSAVKEWIRHNFWRSTPDGYPDASDLKDALDAAGIRGVFDDLYAAIVREEYDIAVTLLNKEIAACPGVTDVTVSELIAYLHGIKAKYGDVMVYVFDTHESVSDPVVPVYCPEATCVVLTTDGNQNRIAK